MKKEKVVFPYGVSNLESIIREDKIFVDKTHFLPLLEKEEKYVSFLRPRKMGKSLFLSILEYYYDIDTKNIFDDIFGRLYIGKNKTPLANSFRILKFDLSGIDTRDSKSSEEGFTNNVRKSIDIFMETYQVFTKEKKQDILSSKKNAAEIIGEFFAVYKHEKIKIYLIIDEYDHFTNEILLRNLQDFKNSVTQSGYVRKFYENIKVATQSGVVNRFFITGVSPITLDSLTSGFNIVTHLSHSQIFNDLIGFTQSEVENLLDLILEDESRKNTILEDLKTWYNGYKFNVDADHTIYNANMVLFFLKEFQYNQQYPRQMLDPNIAPDYQKVRKMIEIGNTEMNFDTIENILENKQIISEQIYQFDFSDRFDEVYFINFLYYLGNLTIKSAGKTGVGTIFKVPNLVIENLYWQYYASVLSRHSSFQYSENKIKQSIYALTEGNLNLFLNIITQTLKGLSNRDFQKFDEKYIKMLLIAYASIGDALYIQSEREVKNIGYIDIEFWKKPNNLIEHDEYIFEVKYIKKENEDTFENIKNKAIQQLKKYKMNCEILKNKKMLRSFVLIFIKDELFTEEVF